MKDSSDRRDIERLPKFSCVHDGYGDDEVVVVGADDENSLKGNIKFNNLCKKSNTTETEVLLGIITNRLVDEISARESIRS